MFYLVNSGISSATNWDAALRHLNGDTAIFFSKGTFSSDCVPAMVNAMQARGVQVLMFHECKNVPKRCGLTCCVITSKGLTEGVSMNIYAPTNSVGALVPIEMFNRKLSSIMVITSNEDVIIGCVHAIPLLCPMLLYLEFEAWQDQDPLLMAVIPALEDHVQQMRHVQGVALSKYELSLETMMELYRVGQIDNTPILLKTSYVRSDARMLVDALNTITSDVGKWPHLIVGSHVVPGYELKQYAVSEIKVKQARRTLEGSIRLDASRLVSEYLAHHN